jgi:hypothetical protein
MRKKFTIIELSDGQQVLGESIPDVQLGVVLPGAATTRTAELDVTESEFADLQKRIAKKPVDFDTLKVKAGTDHKTPGRRMQG